jgi:hypothetical protein
LKREKYRHTEKKVEKKKNEKRKVNFLRKKIEKNVTVER